MGNRVMLYLPLFVSLFLSLGIVLCLPTLNKTSIDYEGIVAAYMYDLYNFCKLIIILFISAIGVNFKKIREEKEFDGIVYNTIPYLCKLYFFSILLSAILYSSYYIITILIMLNK